ncbi:MAG: DUF2520 domain-containing protein [Planctomycetota bacterium]|nr:DUF2520 domain-containing protein [Planctomycetota bacterium]
MHRLRLAVVGPGRVGQGLARGWAEAGVSLLGFVGRDEAACRSAVAGVGHGRPLQLGDLGQANVIVFAVGDSDLPAAVTACAAALSDRGPGLWLHTSGMHDLSVLAPLAGASVRLGALHPVLPFPDPQSARPQFEGRPAVLLGEPQVQRLLRRLVQPLGMRPLSGQAGDRTLYHAACAIAANGLTALRSVVDRVLAESSVLDREGAATLADELMSAALDACRRLGARDALSGPIVRGDSQTVSAHRQALEDGGLGVDGVYRGLMSEALRLAGQRGLDDGAVADLMRVLAAPNDSSS